MGTYDGIVSNSNTRYNVIISNRYRNSKQLVNSINNLISILLDTKK